MNTQEELHKRLHDALLACLFSQQVVHGRQSADFRNVRAEVARMLNRPIADAPVGRRSGTRKFDWGFEVMFMQVVEALAEQFCIEVRYMDGTSGIITRGRRVRDFRLTDSGITYTRETVDLAAFGTLPPPAETVDHASSSSASADSDTDVIHPSEPDSPPVETTGTSSSPPVSDGPTANEVETDEMEAVVPPPTPTETQSIAASIAETRIMTKSEIGNLSETVRRLLADDSDDHDKDESDRRQPAATTDD